MLWKIEIEAKVVSIGCIDSQNDGVEADQSEKDDERPYNVQDMPEVKVAAPDYSFGGVERILVVEIFGDGVFGFFVFKPDGPKIGDNVVWDGQVVVVDAFEDLNDFFLDLHHLVLQQGHDHEQEEANYPKGN